jgi:carbamoyltransferase
MIVLGINAYHADAAACLVIDGRLEVAIEEERLVRTKHWAGFPARAIRSCLDHAGLSPAEIDHVAIGRDPRANLLRKTGYVLRARPPAALVRGSTASNTTWRTSPRPTTDRPSSAQSASASTGSATSPRRCGASAKAGG